MVDQTLLFFEHHLLLFIVLTILVAIFITSDIVFLAQFCDKALWYQYWKYNIDDTKHHFKYHNTTWFGKIILWAVIIIPRLILLTPIILIYMAIAFIIDILCKLLYKR